MRPDLAGAGAPWGPGLTWGRPVTLVPLIAASLLLPRSADFLWAPIHPAGEGGGSPTRSSRVALTVDRDDGQQRPAATRREPGHAGLLSCRRERTASLGVRLRGCGSGGGCLPAGRWAITCGPLPSRPREDRAAQGPWVSCCRDSSALPAAAVTASPASPAGKPSWVVIPAQEGRTSSLPDTSGGVPGSCPGHYFTPAFRIPPSWDRWFCDLPWVPLWARWPCPFLQNPSAPTGCRPPVSVPPPWGPAQAPPPPRPRAALPPCPLPCWVCGQPFSGAPAHPSAGAPGAPPALSLS